VSRIELFAAASRFPPPLLPPPRKGAISAGFPVSDSTSRRELFSSPRRGRGRRGRARGGRDSDKSQITQTRCARRRIGLGVMSYAAGNNIIIGPCGFQRDVFRSSATIFRAQLLVSALDLCRRPFFVATPDADGFQYRCPRGQLAGMHQGDRARPRDS